MQAFGLNITIENPKGSIRYGHKWQQVMHNDYGYIDNTIAVDGDELDCFIGPNLDSKNIYIVEQLDPNTDLFDEYKVMLGFNNSNEAREAYMSNYKTGWQGFNYIIERDIFNFMDWYKANTGFLYAET